MASACIGYGKPFAAAYFLHARHEHSMSAVWAVTFSVVVMYLQYQV